jgi:hypothetical protein
MRKIILAILLSGTLMTLQAQTEQGDWLVGGRIDFNSGENTTNVSITPQAGYFVINNLAVGGSIAFNYSKIGSNKVTTFGIGPFARYYFTTSNVRPLIHGELNFLNRKIKTSTTDDNDTGLNIFLGGGVAIFVSDNVSLEPIIGYNNVKYKDVDGSGGFRFGFGFQVYINKGQVAKMNGK